MYTAKKLISLFYLGVLSLQFCIGQALSQKEIIKVSEDNLYTSLLDYKEFLAIPNNGRIKEHISNNLNWCKNTFETLGFKTQIIEEDDIPHLLAERIYNKHSKTILVYLQIDGQPVDSTKWQQPNPYEAQLKSLNNDSWESVNWNSLTHSIDPELRIFARSASDSKGSAMTFITALKILKAKGITPKYNVKVIMDFQEELGSPKLTALVKKNAPLFDAEMMLVMDGTRHLSNLPTLTFGARGLATVKLKVFGANTDLHSGQYGNFAPNPVFKMSKLLASFKDEYGRVVIPGFYDGVQLSNLEKEAINNLPENLDSIKKFLGISHIDQVGATYQESLQYPSLNVRGLRAAWVGNEVRTLIPAEAIAEIDMRLVPETPGKRQVKLLRNFIKEQGFHIVDSIPTIEERARYPKLVSVTHRIGSKPFRTPMDSDIGDWLSKSMQHIFDDNYIKMRTTGGSQPISPFINSLGIPAVSVRIPNPDNNIHAPNENIRVGNYLEGIQTCLSILVQELN